MGGIIENWTKSNQPPIPSFPPHCHATIPQPEEGKPWQLIILGKVVQIYKISQKFTKYLFCDGWTGHLPDWGEFMNWNTDAGWEEDEGC